MNSDIADIADWAKSQGWTVKVDSKGYTRFFDPDGDYITNYPNTPRRPNRRMADLTVALKKAGLPLPPPSKKELRAQRNREKGQP